MEMPASLRAFALDKTGTLTEGRPRVAEVISLNDHGPRELLAVAAAVETDSNHPIARAVVDYAEAEGITVPDTVDVEIVPGKGASREIDGQWWWLGSISGSRSGTRRGLRSMPCSRSAPAPGERLSWSVRTNTSVVCSCSPTPCARGGGGASVGGPDCCHAHRRQRGNRIRGASEVCIETVRAELLPSGKVVEVERLEREFGPVVMIGDGVNDAPALARASLGVAMGAMGTHVAVGTADVALMHDDLTRLAWLVTHSKRTIGIIQQNVVVVLGIKLVFVVLTMFGVATLWGAIAADMGASLLVVFNSLRLWVGANPQAEAANA